MQRHLKAQKHTHTDTKFIDILGPVTAFNDPSFTSVQKHALFSPVSLSLSLLHTLPNKLLLSQHLFSRLIWHRQNLCLISCFVSCISVWSQKHTRVSTCIIGSSSSLAVPRSSDCILLLHPVTASPLTQKPSFKRAYFYKSFLIKFFKILFSSE